MRRPRQRHRKTVAVDTALLDLFRAAMDAVIAMYPERGSTRMSQAWWHEKVETHAAFDLAIGLKTWELSPLSPHGDRPELREQLLAMATPAWAAFYPRKNGTNSVKKKNGRPSGRAFSAHRCPKDRGNGNGKARVEIDPHSFALTAASLFP
jgi:hypothetical protein